MAKHTIGNEEMLDPGEKVTLELEGRDIAVFNVDGELFAYTSWCAHQGGPCGEGNITGTYVDSSFDRENLQTQLEWGKENKILNCPWHGWEYDIETGECISKKNRRIPSHDVEIRDGNIIVEI